MKLIWANFQPAIKRQSLDKSARIFLSWYQKDLKDFEFAVCCS